MRRPLVIIVLPPKFIMNGQERCRQFVKRADRSLASDLETAVRWLPSINPAEHWGKILLIAAQVKEELELRVSMGDGSGNRDQAFGPGAVYEFFTALSNIISSGTKTLFIVDPYMDGKIFDTYLAAAKPSVACRLLLQKYAANVKPAAELFGRQHGLIIDLRKSDKIHDRLVFVDGLECWVLGQSIKDAADKKPTYLAPLSPDVSQLKLAHYDDIWNHHSSSII